jgi:hypothetical protein
MEEAIAWDQHFGLPSSTLKNSVDKHLGTTGTNFTFQLKLETTGLKIPTSKLSGALISVYTSIAQCPNFIFRSNEITKL